MKMSAHDSDLMRYYARRTWQYERIYHKPERLVDLAELRVQLPLLLRRRDVLELACGTGYWTQFVALEARTVQALDINEETLAIARSKNYPRRNVSFQQGDAYRPDVTGKFDSGLAAFWFSHVSKHRIDEFLQGFQALSDFPWSTPTSCVLHSGQNPLTLQVESDTLKKLHGVQ